MPESKGRKSHHNERAPRSKRAGAGSQRETNDPNVAYVLGPQRERLKSFFNLVFSIGAAADDSLRKATKPEQDRDARLFIFDACVFTRAVNALKSVRVLCEEGQWEFAAGAVRQLFELILNVEHLKTLPDRDQGNARFAKYGLMQQIERERGSLLYAQKTGRDVDKDRLQQAEEHLASAFPEFRSVSSKGRLDRKPYWSGHSVRALAKESNHPLRLDQYDLLFVPYSEQAHGAPSVLVSAMFPRSVKPEEVFAEDSIRIGETLIMAINLFLELWDLLEHVPPPPVRQRAVWVRATESESKKFGVWPSTQHLHGMSSTPG